MPARHLATGAQELRPSAPSEWFEVVATPFNDLTIELVKQKEAGEKPSVETLAAYARL